MRSGSGLHTAIGSSRLLRLNRRYRPGYTKLYCCDVTDKQHREKPTLSNMEIDLALTASISLRERLQTV